MNIEEVLKSAERFSDDEIRQLAVLQFPEMFYLRVEMETIRLKSEGVKCPGVKAYHNIEELYFSLFGVNRYSEHDSFKKYKYRKNRKK